MKPTTVHKGTLVISLLSIIPHLFCCGIPAIAAIIALGGTVGLGATLAANPLYNLIDPYHTQLITLAIIGVVVSGILNFIAYRVDCRKAACTHGSCKPTKIKSFRIFLLSLGLLALDIAWFTTEELVLGIHHHHEEEHHDDHDEHKEHEEHNHHH
ncbi:MAG: hypothetical protein OXR68_08305 [Alphaproteobacteria bacterium]|nr:hypothetical protein [Alphaproteobacteria bacterium]MDD9920607.1 hypothetical protein [Alphaproteobacteria bacterium]